MFCGKGSDLFPMAASTVLAMRSSSIRNLNTESYIVRLLNTNFLNGYYGAIIHLQQHLHVISSFLVKSFHKAGWA